MAKAFLDRCCHLRNAPGGSTRWPSYTVMGFPPVYIPLPSTRGISYHNGQRDASEFVPFSLSYTWTWIAQERAWILRLSVMYVRTFSKTSDSHNFVRLPGCLEHRRSRSHEFCLSSALSDYSYLPCYVLLRL